MPGAYPLPAGLATPELSTRQRRALVGAIVALHLLGIWALLQVNAVRQAVLQAAPIFVDLLAPPAPPAMPPPPAALPAPLPPLKPVPLKRLQPLPKPAPLLAAPAAAPVESFGAPQAPTPPPPAPPVAAAPVAAPAPAAAAAPPAAPRVLPDAAVQYLVPPQVVYPRLSQRHRETGRVLVRAYVGSTGGAPLSAQIEQSSGHARLDQAALDAVHKARFKPYAENGRPVEGWALIPIDFQLE